MKIIYLSLFRDPRSGVGKKIDDQIKALGENGVEILPVLASDFIKKNTLLGNRDLKNTLSLRAAVLNECKTITQNNSPDLIYCRFPGSDSFFSTFLSRIQVPVITEHNSFELNEFALYSKIKWASESLWGKSVRGKISGFVGVTSEITKHELQRSPDTTKPSITISNGINVNSVAMRKCPDFDNTGLNLLCVASVSIWHGIDRVLKGMADYQRQNVFLHIVGDGSIMPKLQDLVMSKGLQEQVIFHGFKTGKNLDEMFAKSHIAVGSLGIHRKGLSETSELKAREYCARGIPFFNSAFDEDFPESFPFRLKVPADDTPINMEEIMRFAKKVLAEREHPQIMREYALSNLDWKIKMRKLKGFFEEVLKKQVEK